MMTKFACVVSTAIALTAGASILAAPGQNTTYPGAPTKPGVWVENRGRGEAIPIVLQEVATPTPMGVQVIGTPTVTIGSSSVVQVRAVRQSWEYRSVTIPLGQAASDVTTLTNAGTDGWETTGIQVPGQSGIVVVLKRPR
jgi:hypothetical protein